MFSIRQIGIIGRTYRHLTRYRQILTIFFKYGLGEFVDLLKIEQYIETGLQMISRKQREHTTRLSRAERVRMAFEELGPTFIKLGQVLSSQPGLIPIDIVEELAQLQDNVPPGAFEAIELSIADEFKMPAQRLFQFIEPRPIASASIAQVYKARLHSGETVAVKVRRPGIKRTIEVDLEIMMYLAGVLERNVHEFAQHKPTKIVEEFARVLAQEMDFTFEAANVERFARQFAEDKTIYVPQVFRRYTSDRVLTLEFIDGIKITDIKRLEAEGYDKQVIIKRGTDLTLRQVFIHGFFHADPHPGNIFILPGNVICPLDYGMVGYVDLKHREMFVDLLDSLVRQKIPKATRVMLQIAIWDKEPDVIALERDLADFIGHFFYKPLKELEVGKLLQNMLVMLTKHHLRLPPNIFLMMKAMGTIEGIAKQIDPDFDIITNATPFARKVMLARYSPGRIAGELARTAGGLHHFAQQFPDDLMDLARRLKEGKITINIEHKGFDNLMTTHDRVSNRLSFSIIIAALLIGSAMIVTTKVPPLVFGISLFGIIGFVGAAFMGIWLLIGILRKGRL